MVLRDDEDHRQEERGDDQVDDAAHVNLLLLRGKTLLDVEEVVTDGGRKSREGAVCTREARRNAPFQPEKATYEAGRILLQRISSLIDRGEDFTVETTLAALVYKDIILKAQSNGYRVNLLFFWLNSAALAKERVRLRVMEGGHNVSDTVVERRYHRGIKNLFNVFIPLCDNVMVFDNSELNHRLIMGKVKGHADEIYDINTYNQILATC